MERTNISDITKRKSNLFDYQDKNAISEVLGCLIQNPGLLKEHPLRQEDFVDSFHKTVFSVIHNMIRDGATDIQPSAVSAYLEQNYPSKYELFTKHNGIKYMEEAVEYCSPSNFEMNYNAVRKWSLLRELAQSNINVSDYYDPEDVSVDEESEAKRDNFEQSSVEDILRFYRTKLIQISSNYTNNGSVDSRKAGSEGAVEQLESWKHTPAFGFSYASQFLTTVTYGIRPKKFAVVSSPSGTGKTRMTIANMCFSFAPYFWNSKKGEWEANPHGTNNSALYIGTEMDLLEEVEPIIWAYMADVPEDHITQNEYEPGEEERVLQAIKYLNQKDENGKDKNCGIFLEYVPEYDVDTLETIIDKYCTLYHIKAVFFDYIYSNPKLLAEYSSASKGRYSMRDDQALSNLSTKLKDLTRKYEISIDSCTQVSGDYKNAANYDETIVRGARSIIDKCDIGIIMTRVTQQELQALEPITTRGEMIGKQSPNLCLTVYKNRGGRYGKVKIWLFVDYRTMRVHDLFVTNLEYEILKIEKSRVVIDNNGKAHIFTNTDAMEEFKNGYLTKAMMDNVHQQEKDDPSFKRKSRGDNDKLKQAKLEASDTTFGIVPQKVDEPMDMSGMDEDFVF